MHELSIAEVNKVDLLEHLDFDINLFPGNLDAVNPGVECVLTSAARNRAPRGHTRSKTSAWPPGNAVQALLATPVVE